VTVTNSSAVPGDEVIEAYLKTPQAGGPVRSLAGFQRVNIPAGESKDVTITVEPRTLSSVDDQGNRAILEGKYTLTLGGAQPQETQAKSEAGFAVTGSMALPK
jgi:beta-glucosidase